MGLWIYNPERQVLYNLEWGIVLFVDKNPKTGKYMVYLDSIHLPDDGVANLVGYEYDDKEKAVEELEFIIDHLDQREIIYLEKEE